VDHDPLTGPKFKARLPINGYTTHPRLKLKERSIAENPASSPVSTQDK
jgi:hypothetical protein